MSQNPALDTKVKAMQAQLLNQEDYKELIQANSVAEVLDYLKQHTHYTDYLKGLEPQKASRTEIEAALNQIVLDHIDKLLYFIRGIDRDFMSLLEQQIDLESLLVLFRALSKPEDFKNILNQLTFSDDFFQCSFQEVEQVKDFSSLKEVLKGTIYYRSIETYEKLNEEDLFELEKTLERSYYDLLYKRIGELNSKTNKDLIDLLRSEIDILNLIWIYRSKKFYNYSSDQILPFIYRGGLHIREDTLRRLSEIPDYEELITALRSFKNYKFLFDHPEDQLDLHMDRRKKRYLYYQYKKILSFGKAIAAAYSYINLLEDEISDITSILEAKRYNLSPEAVNSYLIRTLES